MTTEAPRKRRLGDVLVEWGAIKPELLAQALQAQRASPTRTRLGTMLLQHKLIDELTLASALAEVHNLRTIDLDTVQVDSQLARALPRETGERLEAIPVTLSNGYAVVAVADPLDVVGADELRMRLNRPIQLVVATPSQIRRKQKEIWEQSVSNKVVESFVDTLASSNVVPDGDDFGMEGDGAVAIVNQIIAAAAARRASDIHIEPDVDALVVRVRSDGIMQEILRLPLASMAPIVSRIKVMAGLDVVQRRHPQDGRMRIREGGRRIDLRLSTMPCVHGESVVMRLLPTQQDLPSLEQLGLPAPYKARLTDELTRTQGFLIVTGPTGSGKSTSIYSMISAYMGPDRKVITMEDPVEMELSGIVQVQIEENGGVTFPAALRASLRQDPDVVIVGEVRDLETAQLSVSAALTGHLVLTTLHTQDALSAVDRLVHMGVPRYLVAQSVGLVFAQRLLRRPCGFCSERTPPDAATAEALHLTPAQAASMVQGKGCVKCANTGYMGRIGVYEMLDMSDEVREAFLAAERNADILKLARKEGFQSLREIAVTMASHGLTTVTEVLRSTPRPDGHFG